MKRYVAFLRGINVGGSNRLPMGELRAILESLGIENPKTWIQTGNVVFESLNAPDTLEQKISEAIAKEHGFSPEVLVLTLEALEEIIQANPFPRATSDPGRLHVYILREEPSSPDLEALQAISRQSERFSLTGRAFYLHAPDGIGRSKLAAGVEKRLGVPATARNWKTLTKVREMSKAD